MRGRRYRNNSRRDVTDPEELRRGISLQERFNNIETLIATRAEKSEVETLEMEVNRLLESGAQASASSFAENFYAETGQVTVSSGNSFPLSNSLFHKDIESDRNFQYIEKTAMYSVFFSISYTGEVGALVSLAIDDVPVQSTVCKLMSSSGTITSMVILSINAGSKLSIVNSSSDKSIFLDTSTGFPLNLVTMQITKSQEPI